jgi:hypothetical protein
VDLGAIFRLVPGLVDGNTSAAGTIDLQVSDATPAMYRVTLTGAGGEISESTEDGSPDAVVQGTTASWIRALGPMGERDGLTTSGNAALAATLLDLVALGQGSQAPMLEAERDLESAASN